MQKTLGWGLQHEHGRSALIAVMAKGQDYKCSQRLPTLGCDSPFVPFLSAACPALDPFRLQLAEDLEHFGVVKADERLESWMFG